MADGRTIAFVAAFVVAALAAPAGATAMLPPPVAPAAVTGTLYVGTDSQSLSGAGTLYAANNTAELSAVLTPDPQIYIFSAGQAYGFANIRYDYVVAVPLGTNAAPAEIDGLVTATGNYSLHVNSGYAAVQIDTDTVNYYDPRQDGFFRTSTYNGIVGSTFSIGGPGNYAGTAVEGGVTEALYTGTLHLNAALTTPGIEDGQAFIDPIITINAPALAGAGFTGTPTLMLSGGVGNGASPTPEPGTWALLAAGFGIGGAIVRRRRAAIA